MGKDKRNHASLHHHQVKFQPQQTETEEARHNEGVSWVGLLNLILWFNKGCFGPRPKAKSQARYRTVV